VVAPGCRLTLPGIDADAVILARAGDREAAWSAGPGDVTLTDLGAADAGSVLTMVWRA